MGARELWSWAWPIAATAMGAVFAWFAIWFIGNPLRSFFDLRREIHRQVVFLGNVGPPPDHVFVTDIDIAAFAEHAEISAAAAKVLRDLGAQAIAFDRTEWIASKLIRAIGLRPMEAGRGLVALANALEHEASADEQRMRIARALRFDTSLFEPAKEN